MKHLNAWIVIATCLGSNCTLAHADAEDAATGVERSIGIGLATMVRAEPYRGVGTKSRLLPVLYYESERVTLAGGRGEFRVLERGPAEITLLADYRFDGFDSGDSEYLSGLTRRDGTLMLGIGARYSSEFGVLAATATQGVHASRGRRAELSLSHPIHAGGLTLAPRLALEVLDARYVDYYFGVTAGEALASRPAYSGRRAVNVEIGVEAGYVVTRHHRLAALAGYRRLGSAIGDSPLIEKRGVPTAAVAYVYTF